MTQEFQDFCTTFYQDMNPTHTCAEENLRNLKRKFKINSKCVWSKKILRSLGINTETISWGSYSFVDNSKWIELDHFKLYKCDVDESYIAITSPYNSEDRIIPYGWKKIPSIYSNDSESYMIHFRFWKGNIKVIDDD